MDYVPFTVNDTEYKLKLTTRNMVALEKVLGCNPITVFLDFDEGKLPKISDIALILHSSLQAFHHNNDINKTYDLLDGYLASHSLFEITTTLIEVFQEAGLIPKENEAEEVDEKNA